MSVRSSVIWATLIAAIAALILFASSPSPAAPAATTHVASAQVRFSPQGGCEEMIVREIGTAQTSVHVLAFNFTSRPIADALIAAHRRGVEVHVIVDKSCPHEAKTVYPHLLGSKVPTRIDHKHAIAHNKVILVDGEDVETGSFNFTGNAENDNAENAIILRNWPGLVAQYEADFQRHWGHAEPAK